MTRICEDIKLNLGPKQKHDQSLSICYWNLISIPAHNYQKLKLFQGHIQVIKLTFYGSLRPFLIQIFHVLKTICNYQDLNWSMHLLSEFPTFKTNQYSLP